ncbi:uncharacterized protein LOC123561568 isoform X2 [Mercenaria mercenaria]|nr:uncharacterized protein LOC123561568 isoform X2 [Mercenaria mercenaria]
MGVSRSDETRQSERTHRNGMSSEEKLQNKTHPVKPPRVAQEKLQNDGNDINKSTSNIDPTNFQACSMSASGVEELEKCSQSIAQHFNEPDFSSHNRFRAKRNERGLCSKSDVPNVIDNRYYFLSRKDMIPAETLTTDMAARNSFRGTPFQNPKSLPQAIHSSKLNREYQMIPNDKHSDKFDDAFEEGLYNEIPERYARNDPMLKSSYSYRQEETARRPDRHLQNNTTQSEEGEVSWRTEKYPRKNKLLDNTNPYMQEECARRSDRRLQNSQNQSEKVIEHRKSEEFPQNSQFYNETIVYPESPEEVPYTDRRQTATTGRSNQWYHSSYNSGDPENSYRRNKPAYHWESSHSSRQSVRPSAQFAGDETYGPYGDPIRKDDLEDFDDLDDVPAFDDIPYALIITGMLDDKTIIRAKRKQMQQMALDLIKGQSGKLKAGEKMNKNKNQGPFVSKSSRTRTETYREQVLANRTHPSGEAFQSHLRNSVDNKDTTSQSGNEFFQKQTIDTSSSNRLRTITETGHDETQKPSDEARILNKDSKTNSDETVTNVTKISFKGSVEIEKQKSDLERSSSPFHIADEMEDTTSNFVTRPDMKQVNEEQKKPVNEKQRSETEKEKFIREKRLEKLKIEEISGVNKVPEITQKHKPDNREVTFHSDIVHKPVKSKAFRSKVPNFMSDNEPQQKKDDTPEATECRNNSVEQHIPSKMKSISSASNTRNDKKPDGQPSATKLQTTKDEPTGKGIPQRNTNFTGNKEKDIKNMVELKGTSKESGIHDVEGDRDISDEETEPIAMKMLRRQNQQTKMKHSGYFSKQQPVMHPDDDDKDLVEPSAMRILRQSKEAKERSERKETKDGSLSQTSISPILDALFGGKPGSITQGDTSSTLRISDFGNTARKSKQLKKNKNKNVSPLQKGVESSVGETRRTEDTVGRVLLVIGLDKQPDDEEVTNGNEFQSVPVTILKVADKRHKAFQKLKMSQSEDYLKCTSCGRPECQGHNIKKMKEIIRIAKQAGFEVRDVIPDGNCMFAAVVDQLQLYGDYRFGPKSLREAAVSWLIEHPFSDDGTHYSSFLAEDWEVYLQRMMAEGEWGDHLILRAVVETIGHTIKVLNVSGEESHWTILEPASIDVSKDGMHLVLGHVGEFHYTSLRPADAKTGSFVPVPMSPIVQDAQVADDDGQISLEGTETVEMFREDYVDTWSDMPSVHFSYLLKNVIPIKVVDKAAIIQSQFTDNLSGSVNFRVVESSTGTPIEMDTEFGGSVAEGVYVPHLKATIGEDASVSDIVTLDVYGIMKKYIVVGQKSEAVLGEGRLECVVDTTGVHTGYAKLLSTQWLSGGLEEYSRYLPQIKTQNDGSDVDRCLRGCDLPRLHFRRISALRCRDWPECAKSWVSRVRREGWPAKDIISSIKADGCLLLSDAHKESKCPDIEWQFSFAICERKLFKDAVSLYQKYCYILFDALCTQTMHHLESICSSHFKNVFFYACERIPLEFWESSPGACVFYMLDELLRYIRAKNLPHYFVHANNMIDHLKEKDFKEIEEQIILLRSQPVLFLRQINESLGMLPHGNTIIDKVTDDIAKFKEHKSLKRSTLEVFIPATIDTAQYCIRMRSFEEGYEILSQAFQQRLSVSTCDDSVPFQIFLPGAVSGLDLDSLVWFSAFTDRQLEGQLSKSLVRETCGDLQLVKIKDILPADVVGSYGNTEVPAEFSHRLCSFCYDFAKFLFQTNKLSEILPILYHCHEIFVKKLEDAKSLKSAHDRNDEQQASKDFTDEAMFDIYTAMYTVYKKQQQMEFFRAVMPVVDALVERIHTRWAYNCLCHMYQSIGDKGKLTIGLSIYEQLPEDPLEQTRVTAFLYWPRKVKTYSVYSTV